MKKTLIALAAVAATGAAFAQSSVTLYGVADISIGDNNVAGSKLAASANGGGTGSLNNGNSRWGVRGTEDLGGGLKAGFNFEQNVSLADGSTCNLPTCTAGQPGLNANGFQRAANVSLAGGFGSLTAGRQLNPSFHSVASWELTGMANYSAVGKQFGSANSGLRDNAMIAYTSPDFGGLKASLGVVLKGNSAAAPQTGKTDFTLTYAAGPLAASFAYNKVETAKANMAIGAKYNLGVATVAASYLNLGSTKTAALTARKGFTLGVSAPVGPLTLTADLARATDTSNKATDFLLEAKYPLSKRTFGYAAFLSDATQGAATVKTWGVGVRHNF